MDFDLEVEQYFEDKKINRDTVVQREHVSDLETKLKVSARSRGRVCSVANFVCKSWQTRAAIVNLCCGLWLLRLCVHRSCSKKT